MDDDGPVDDTRQVIGDDTREVIGDDTCVVIGIGPPTVP